MKSPKDIIREIIYLILWIICVVISVLIFRQYADQGGQNMLSFFILPFCLYTVKGIVEDQCSDRENLINVINTSIWLSYPVQLFFLTNFDFADQFYQRLELSLNSKLNVICDTPRLIWSVYFFILITFLIFQKSVKSPFRFTAYYLITFVCYMYFIYFINSIGT